MIYLKFIHIKTKEERKSVHVERPLIIGRGALADIQLDDDEDISRLHTLVVPRPDSRLEIRDLSSKWGTIVLQDGKQKRLIPQVIDDGYEKGRATLNVGDKFFVCGYQIEVCFEEVIGEPTMGFEEEEEEITGIEEIDNLKNR